ncbi:MAG: PHP domain-containing protein [Candidatus Cloacimonetes bacterium]|nr:PHP domain-containing protein [Candidatus Cloacimonadota bacterium]
MKIDLHLHTTFSDGKLSPEEMIRNAYENHYSFISITDHDTFAGYLEAKEFMKDKYHTLELIPGVEISTIFENTEVHILAYYFDETNEDLIELLKQVYDSRYGRALEMVARLKTFGIELDWASVLSYAGKNKYIGRPHIARALITNGSIKTIREAFDKYLHNDSPAYVPKLKVDTEYAINVIKKAGGISVLAHPGRLSDDSIVYNCIDMGIDGLEVYYVSHITGQTRLYEQIALENNLVRTGGTDFHGNEFFYVNYSAPDICIKDLKALNEKRKNK